MSSVKISGVSYGVSNAWFLGPCVDLVSRKASLGLLSKEKPGFLKSFGITWVASLPCVELRVDREDWPALGTWAGVLDAKAVRLCVCKTCLPAASEVRVLRRCELIFLREVLLVFVVFVVLAVGLKLPEFHNISFDTECNLISTPCGGHQIMGEVYHSRVNLISELRE